MTPVLARTIRGERRPILGWLIGIGLLVLVTTGSWPALEESADDFDEVLANLPDGLTAFLGEGLASFSAASIVGSRLFGTIALVIFIGFAVSRGARAIAGEEAEGTMELLVTQPISRTAIAVDKAVAAYGTLALLVLAQMVLLLLLMPVAGLDFAVANVVGASAGIYLLASMFGSVAFAVGAATGRRGLAVAAGAGVAGGLFFLGGLGQLIEALSPFAEVSPFVRYDGVAALTDGAPPGTLAVFAALTIALTALGVWAFGRRDLT